MKFQTALALVVVVGSLPAACTPVENKESTADDSAGRDTGEKDPGGNDGWYRDDDGDGFLGEMEDCDDTNAAVNPDAAEDCGNQIDDDCDGDIDTADSDCAGVDGDSDGWTFAQDCDDSNAQINPGAAEECSNGLDDNCDGAVDDNDPSCPESNSGWYQDNDGDGFLGEMEDCDDTNAAVNPDAPEDCGNQIDDDCDGNIDSADADCTAGAQRQGLDWSRLAFCAPDGQPAGMRSYRNQSSPFLPG